MLLLTRNVSPEPPWNSSIVPLPPSITGNLITEILPFTAASSASQSPFSQLPINIMAALPCLNAATASSSDVPIALLPNPPLAASSCTFLAASVNSGVLKDAVPFSAALKSSAPAIRIACMPKIIRPGHKSFSPKEIGVIPAALNASTASSSSSYVSGIFTLFCSNNSVFTYKEATATL